MIPYEELVAALDRFVSRQAGAAHTPGVAPQRAGAPGSATAPSLSPAPSFKPASPRLPAPSAHDIDLHDELPAYDEHHDPDLPPLVGQHEEDATHVGASPLSPLHDDHSSEIDIDDVLHDEEG